MNQISTPQRSLGSSRENSYEDAQIDQSIESYNTYDYNDYNNDLDLSSQQDQNYDTCEEGGYDEFGNWIGDLEYEDASTVMDGEILEHDAMGELSYNSRPNMRKDYK